ncbi:MAG: DUF2922 domain-containing protein [Syntrophomonadaceae bacterium]
MATERSLELYFTTSGDRSFHLSIPDAKPDLTASGVNTAMNEIIALNVFSVQGGTLAEKKSANLVIKETVEYTIA